MSEKIERLMNLTATLLDTRRPLSLDQIADRLEPGYPDDLAARRRSFERDKETLRDMGIPISVESTDSLGGESGYRIRPSDYYLPDLDLTIQERAALHIAVTAVRVGSDAGRAGLTKLGGIEGPGSTPIARLDLSGELAGCFDAVVKRAPLFFSYRGDKRQINHYGVLNRLGNWYVVGHDLDKGLPRAFRVDRIEGSVAIGKAKSFDRPDDLDVGSFVKSDPITYGEDDPFDALVLVDKNRAVGVVAQLGEECVVERKEDGAVVVTMRVVNKEAFRTWVLSLLEHAKVLSPDECVAEMVAWLKEILARSK